MGTFLTSCSSQSHKPLLRWEELGVARGGSNLTTGYLVSPLGGYRHSYLVSPQGAIVSLVTLSLWLITTDKWSCLANFWKAEMLSYTTAAAFSGLSYRWSPIQL